MHRMLKLTDETAVRNLGTLLPTTPSV
jgi:hypothetical protein